MSMGTLEAQLDGACKERRYPPPCSVEDNIQSHVLKRNTRPFAITQSSQTFTIRAGYEEPETAYAGWYMRWKR